MPQVYTLLEICHITLKSNKTSLACWAHTALIAVLGQVKYLFVFHSINNCYKAENLKPRHLAWMRNGVISINWSVIVCTDLGVRFSELALKILSDSTIEFLYSATVP